MINFPLPHGVSSASQFSMPHGNLPHDVSYLSGFSWHSNKYSISLVAEHIYLTSQPCLSGILIPIWPHRCASPDNIIIYWASPPCLSGDIKWAKNPQALLPHQFFGKLF
jgi:hypothetical protein